MENFCSIVRFSRVWLNAFLCFSISTSTICANLTNSLDVQYTRNALQAKTLNELMNELEAYKDDPKRLVSIMYDIKKYVESESGVKLNLREQLVKTQLQLNELGCNLTDYDMQDLEDFIKATHPHRKHIRAIGEKAQPRELPLKVAAGVTIALCGLFIAALPLPGAQTAGISLMLYGGKMALESGLDRVEEDRRNGFGKNIR